MLTNITIYMYAFYERSAKENIRKERMTELFHFQVFFFASSYVTAPICQVIIFISAIDDMRTYLSDTIMPTAPRYHVSHS
jgi:hypothetical protein